MSPDSENNVGPAVQTIVEMFPVEFQAQQTSRVLDDKLNRFKVIQDSTIIGLHESLAKV